MPRTQRLVKYEKYAHSKIRFANLPEIKPLVFAKLQFQESVEHVQASHGVCTVQMVVK